MSIKVNASSRTYATALYSSQAIYSLHRTPENYYTEAQTRLTSLQALVG